MRTVKDIQQEVLATAQVTSDELRSSSATPIIREHLLVVILEEMQAANVHREVTRVYSLPVTISHPALLENPQAQTQTQVDVILEVSEEVAAADVIEDAELVLTHTKQVADSAWSPSAMNYPCVLGKPHW